MIYTLKISAGHPARLILTISGIALCMILMLFLLGIYKGVADGSVDYIRENKADLWVLQHNATNILRGTSILTTFHGEIIKKCKNVESVSPVLLLLTSIKSSKGNSTIFLAGYNPSFSLGGPPKILEGRNVREDKEIVLDQSFAKKNKFNVGDKIEINNDALTVVGISSGTNAFVIQYAFTTIKEAQSIIGFPNLVTCFLIKLKKGSSSGQTLQTLSKMLSGTVIYSHHEFLNNNIKEMESGFLPILYTVALIGAVVLTTLLSLILSINILEKKKDFAVLKMLGAPKGFLPKLVVEQAFLICFLSGLSSVFIFFPLVELIEKLSPEVCTKTNLAQIIIVQISGLIMGLISSIISIRRVRKIYPLEVFYER